MQMKVRRILLPLLAGILFLASGCSWLNGGRMYYSSEEKISVPPGTFDTVVVENRAGTIRIVPATGDRVTGVLARKATGATTVEMKEAVDAVTYRIDTDGNTLTVSEVFRSDDRVDYWNWLDTTYPDVSVGLEYELQVPAGVRVVEVRQTTGNTTIERFDGTVAVINNAGNVLLDRVRLTGDSRIALVSGTLNVTLDALEEGASLYAELTAGSISLQLPNPADCVLSAGVQAGTVSGNLDTLPVTNSTFAETMGTGSSEIILQVESGNIRIDK